jgi:hypothetical protein
VGDPSLRLKNGSAQDDAVRVWDPTAHFNAGKEL